VSSSFSAAIAMGKDFVALLRDAALFLLAVLLIAFPGRFNSMLVAAGFEEGSVVGFKWKSKLVESNRALEEAQLTIAQLQAKNDELVLALNETGRASGDPAVEERLERLGRENVALKIETRTTQARVADTIEANTPLVEKALASGAGDRPAQRSRSDYTVGLQTLGVADSERVALNEGLRGDGYSLDPVTWSYAADQRPSWFAERSTVFHYASSSKPMAEQIARDMKAKTGRDFEVRRGAGLGVDPAKREVTIFVHYIKDR
jgi:hypothetical protein